MPTNLPISTVVNVNIQLQKAVPQQINFNLVCAMTENIVVIPVLTRYVIYTSAAEVLVAFGASDEYDFAVTFFGQSPAPSQLMYACVDTDNETYIEAIAAAYALQNFYGLCLINYDQVDADILDISEFVQTQIMLFFWQSNSADILTNVDTDIFSLLQLQNYSRTVPIFVDNATTERGDAAWASMGLSRQIGTFNWAYKVLVGVTPTSATSGEITIAEAKGANFYVQVGGIPLTQFGTSSSNPQIWIDQTEAIDWLQTNIQTNVLNVQLANEKVAFTDAGVNLLIAGLASTLQQALTLGITVPSPNGNPYTITAIPVSQVSPSLKAQREYSPLQFTAYVGTPINSLQVNGYLFI